MAPGNQPLPSVFVSHGSPMTALDAGPYAQALRDFGQSISPDAVLIFSAHWQEPGISISSAERPELIYDFGGFPRELYEIKYPAPGSPELAAQAAAQLQKAGFDASLDPRRGWDHGVWAPLRLMFPDAHVPIVQISLPMRWSPAELYRAGSVLADFRAIHVLVLGSGGIVHNLRLMNWAQKDAPPESWAIEFQDWVRDRLEARDLDALFDYARLAPHASRAVPTPEHFVPLFPIIGAAGAYSHVLPIFEGVEYGNVSMCTFQLAA